MADLIYLQARQPLAVQPNQVIGYHFKRHSEAAGTGLAVAGIDFLGPNSISDTVDSHVVLWSATPLGGDEFRDGEVTVPVSTYLARAFVGLERTDVPTTVWWDPPRLRVQAEAHDLKDASITSAKYAPGSIGDAALGTLKDTTKQLLDIETHPERVYDALARYRGQRAYNSSDDELLITSANPTTPTGLRIGATQSRAFFHDALGIVLQTALNLKPTLVVGSTTLDATATLIQADTTSGDITLTLPPAGTQYGRLYTFVNIGLTGHKLIVAGAGGDLISGAATQQATTAYSVLRIFAGLTPSGGATWYLI